MHTGYLHKPEFSVVISHSRQVDPLSIAPAQTMAELEVLVISEFRPETIIISDFWAKKLTNSGMTHFNG